MTKTFLLTKCLCLMLLVVACSAAQKSQNSKQEENTSVGFQVKRALTSVWTYLGSDKGHQDLRDLKNAVESLYSKLDVDSALELANALNRVLKSPEMAELWDALVSIIKALANGVRRIQPF